MSFSVQNKQTGLEYTGPINGYLLSGNFSMKHYNSQAIASKLANDIAEWTIMKI